MSASGAGAGKGRTLRVRVRAIVAAAELDPDDSRVAGDYPVEVPAGVEDLVAANIALDIFHATVPISRLESFSIDVLDELGGVMSLGV